MRRRLCILMSVLLTLSIGMPSGAMRAIAEEADATPETEAVALEPSDDAAEDARGRRHG